MFFCYIVVMPDDNLSTIHFLSLTYPFLYDYLKENQKDETQTYTQFTLRFGTMYSLHYGPQFVTDPYP